MNIFISSNLKYYKTNYRLISFDHQLITENNLLDDNRPYRYQQNMLEQQEEQNQPSNIENTTETYNNDEMYMFENLHENRNQNFARITLEKNMSEYTTPESTTSAQNVSQTETSATTQFVRIPTRNIDSRQNTHDAQSSSNTPPQRYITFGFPPSPTEEIQNETQKTTSLPNISVNVLSPTRNNPTTSRGLPRSTYDTPSVPCMCRYPNTTRQATNDNNNNNQQNDPFNYTFFPPSDTNISTNNQHQESSQNNTTNIITQHPYEHLLKTNSPQKYAPSQNQTPSYAIMQILYNLRKKYLKIHHCHIKLLTLYTK